MTYHDGEGWAIMAKGYRADGSMAFGTRDVAGANGPAWWLWLTGRPPPPAVLIYDGVPFVDTGKFEDEWRIYREAYRAVDLGGPLDY